MVMYRFLLLFFIISAFTSFNRPFANNFVTSDALVTFISKANLETITAKSKELKGTLDIQKRTFSITIPISSFEGFINALQKKHFCERYMETVKHPGASFKGKIIEDIDLSVPGTYTFRSKGILMIHGVEKERIVEVKAVVKNGQILIDSKFPVVLEDHGIKISSMNTIVISKTVNVDVKITLIPG